MSLTTPAELAADLGCSERVLKATARRLRACIVAGKAMRFTPEDVVRIKAEMANPLSIGTIYFIKCGRFIKIGFTRQLNSRIAQYKVANPVGVTLLHSEPGFPDDEARYHKLFANWKHRGEWFKHAGNLAVFIEAKQMASWKP